MRERWNLSAVEPIGTERVTAFLNPGGLQDIDMGVYPEATCAAGRLLRSALFEMRIGLRDASTRLGLTPVELCAVERGQMTGDVDGMIEALCAGGSR